jgi:hypothetical protein
LSGAISQSAPTTKPAPAQSAPSAKAATDVGMKAISKACSDQATAEGEERKAFQSANLQLLYSRQALQALREAPAILAGNILRDGKAYRRPSAAGASLEGGAAIDRSVPVSLRDPYRLR